MTFLRSILILITSVLLILVPYAWGHALSNHDATPLVVGGGALLLTLLCGFLLTRRKGAERHPH